MKTQLEIGDKIQRFEAGMTREIDYLDEIISVTKTLAKSEKRIYKRDLNYNTTKPKNSKNSIVERVYLNEKTTWSSRDYFLVESIEKKINN